MTGDQGHTERMQLLGPEHTEVERRIGTALASVPVGSMCGLGAPFCATAIPFIGSTTAASFASIHTWCLTYLISHEAGKQLDNKGKTTRTTSPLPVASCRVICASCTRAISRTIDRPSPVPATLCVALLR